MQSLHLLYHELRPTRTRYSYALETLEFQKQIELFASLRQGGFAGLWPEVTFDDGHLSNYQYALPILQARNIVARFFITVGWTGQRADYMGWPELRSLNEAGQSIGAHGWTHTLLTHCTDGELEHELRDARLALEDKLGCPVTSLSLPGGRFNRKVLAACRDAGYTDVFTSIPRAESLPPGPMIGRLNIRGDMPLSWISHLLEPGSNTLASLERSYRVKSVVQAVLGDRLYATAWGLLNRAEPNANSQKHIDA